MKKLYRRAIALMFVLLLAGCSVGMALSGNSQKDTSILFAGAPRAAVIEKLGQPETTTRNAEGHYVDSYVVVKGNSRSIGRALGHVTMDVFTLGLWELVGTPIEAVASYESTSRVVIYYDAQERVRETRKMAVE